MRKLALGGILLAFSLLMFVGFMRSGAHIGSLATLFALLLTAGVPAVGGGVLIAQHLNRDKTLAGRRESLRQRTLEAEVLRLAAARGGKLTMVEVVSELAVSPDEAKETLDAFTVNSIADVEVTDSGVLVYSFHDIRHIAEKEQSRGLLDG